jgi:alkane 1-monooxygenase
MAVLAGNLAGQRWLLLEVAVVLCVGYVLGQWVAIAFCGQALVSIILLEYVNYIRHYGLRREPDERQTEMHAWQTERRWSRWTLLELTRHPAHHLSASAEDAVPLNEQ